MAEIFSYAPPVEEEPKEEAKEGPEGGVGRRVEPLREAVTKLVVRLGVPPAVEKGFHTLGS